MLPTTIELLRDILREAEFLNTQVARTTLESFLADEVLKRAFVRSLEIIRRGREESAGGHPRGVAGYRMAQDGWDA
jgi:hypothetical protein